MTLISRAAAVACVLVPTAAYAQGLAGKTPGNPYKETSAGRAWQRITFGAIDCGTTREEALALCPNDAFSRSGLFVNGTYRDIRFVYDNKPRGTPSAADFLGNRVITQSQTFPQASSASGFTFTWGDTAVPTLDSNMFGPLFGDRGRSNGRRKLSATLTVQQLRWQRLDGSKIRNGEDGLLWGDDAYAGTAGYVGRCLMDIDSLAASLALTYGITDRLDLTAAVPLVRTTIEGSNQFLDYVILPGGRISTAVADTFFEPQGRFYVRGSSTGIGDVMAGFTYAFVKRKSAALALVGRVNIGTGSSDKMTGTGEHQWSGGLVGSYESGRVAPHFSAAWFGANDSLFDEARGVAGIDFKAVDKRLTLSAELVARRLLEVQGFRATRTLGTVRAPDGEQFAVRNFQAVRDDYNLFFVNVGGKVRVAGQLLATAFVLVPWGSSGLIAQKPSFNGGLSYAF
jgi:hypothetical protein